MRLVSVSLKNIRSYKQATINFPQGVVLLAGDIGSGKSTLLLAVEFALFGLRRGEAQALLRHGTQQGSVSLCINIGEEEILIERSLKKTATSVSQDAGAITQQGKKESLTALELKSKILGLLNYPETLLTQNKNIIFRYTVYTPQEEMKQILSEKPEERLDTLRKLFSIDKYKVARENATLLAREIKSESQRLLGQTDDLETIQKNLEALTKEQKTLQEELDVLNKKEVELNKNKQTITKELQEREEQHAQRQKIEQEHHKKHLELTQKQHENNRLQQEINSLEQTIKELPDDDTTRLQQLQQEITGLKEQIRKSDQTIQKNSNNLAILADKKERLTKITSNVAAIDQCTTCYQEVTQEHKTRIAQENKQKLEKIREREELITKQQEAHLSTQEENKKKLSELELALQKAHTIQTRAQEKERYKKQLRTKQIELTNTKEAINKLREEEQTLLQSLKKEHDKKALEELREQARKVEGEHQVHKTSIARIDERIKSKQEQLRTQQDALAKKKTIRLRARALNEQQIWLNKQFNNLLFTIEKHVLLSVYHQFNDAFKEFFDMLIEDEAISVRLSPDFSPLVEQNGYEVLVDYLSGGEKTSVALAYRLALNKVINQSLENLNTAGLLVLDEPTDGFSSEQLDRVQELLTKLSLEQIILVSHEQKMESFVDHVIKITKEEHESMIH